MFAECRKEEGKREEGKKKKRKGGKNIKCRIAFKLLLLTSDPTLSVTVTAISPNPTGGQTDLLSDLPAVTLPDHSDSWARKNDTDTACLPNKVQASGDL